MKSLKIIQTLAKIGKILSKIVFVCCLVGFCLCIAGLISLAIGGDALRLGGVTVKGLIRDNAGHSVGTLWAMAAAGVFLSAGEAVLAQFAVHYFDRELTDCTPFTVNGAKELTRLGILTIVLPLGVHLLAAIVHAVIGRLTADVAPLQLDNAGSVSLGIMFLVTAQLCRCGAELTERHEA